MYAVIRKFEKMNGVEEAGRRAMAGLGPILQKSPGFCGYYVVDAGNDVGMSISLFDSRDEAVSAHEKALGWIKTNLADLTKSEPQVTTGRVVGYIAGTSAQKTAA